VAIDRRSSKYGLGRCPALTLLPRREACGSRKVRIQLRTFPGASRLPAGPARGPAWPNPNRSGQIRVGTHAHGRAGFRPGKGREGILTVAPDELIIDTRTGAAWLRVSSVIRRPPYQGLGAA
jgi:hypothetical protein